MHRFPPYKSSRFLHSTHTAFADRFFPEKYGIYGIYGTPACFELKFDRLVKRDLCHNLCPIYAIYARSMAGRTPLCYVGGRWNGVVDGVVAQILGLLWHRLWIKVW
jgi:hypothetical protein